MSLLKSKPYWNGILVAVFFAMTASVMAFTPEGMRLWKPYQPEQFGGQRRDADGVYGSVEAIYWKVSNQKNTDVLVMESGLETNYINTDFGLGTRVTFGNQQGHHGWRFSGYGISNLSGKIERQGDLDFSDRGHLFDYRYDYYYYDGGTTTGSPGGDYEQKGGIHFYSDFMNVKEGKETLYNTTKVMDLELAWTYRAHPFSWGTAEFFAGAKYWDFNDKFHYTNSARNNLYRYGYFEGMGAMPSGTINIYYGNAAGQLAVLSSSNSGGTTTGNEVEPAVIVLSNNEISRAVNRIVGPHIGFNLSRRNARWTFNAGASFFAGINQQSYNFSKFSAISLKTQDEILSMAYQGNNNNNNNNNAYNAGNNTDRDASSLTLTELRGLMLMQEQGVVTSKYLQYHRNRTVFSPGVDLQLSTKWQWTDAVGFRVGFDSTVTDNVARGSNLTVTRTQDNDGKDVYTYGFRGKGELVILYGVSFGIEIRR